VAGAKRSAQGKPRYHHPDKENDTATPARKTQLNAAAAIFNAIKFRVLDRD
jgi:hypothetical protein